MTNRKSVAVLGALADGGRGAWSKSNLSVNQVFLHADIAVNSDLAIQFDEIFLIILPLFLCLVPYRNIRWLVFRTGLFGHINAPNFYAH